jgi:hypothetical protein
MTNEINGMYRVVTGVATAFMLMASIVSGRLRTHDHSVIHGDFAAA